MRLLPSCLLAVAVVVALSGCDDDTTGPQDPAFSVVFNVTNPQGQAVAGVHVASMPAVPESYWAPPAGGPTRPVTHIIEFNLDASMPVRVEVRNVAGSTVRLLVDEVLPPGRHGVAWNGRDDAGQPLPGGWYAFHLEYDDQTHDVPCILAVCDPEWHALGTTDGQGRLVVDDLTMVPAFWTLEPVDGVVLTTETLLRLEDASGAGNYATFTAVGGPQTVGVLWDPQPVPFAIDLVVAHDAAGLDPVANARIGGMPAVPGWAWPDGALARSSVAIPFELGQQSTVSLVMKDVTGEKVCTLVEGERPAGQHTVIWNGLDDGGMPTPGGWYQVTFAAAVAGVVVAADSAGVIKGSFEPDQYTWGVTDAGGRVRLSDRRLVPGFRDLPPVTATNQEQVVVGTFEVTTRTWLSVEGAGWVVLDDLVDGYQQITASVQASPLDKLAAPGHRGADDPPPLQTRLRPPYPNPFN